MPDKKFKSNFIFFSYTNLDSKGDFTLTKEAVAKHFDYLGVEEYIISGLGEYRLFRINCLVFNKEKFDEKWRKWFDTLSVVDDVKRDELESKGKFYSPEWFYTDQFEPITPSLANVYKKNLYDRDSNPIVKGPNMQLELKEKQNENTTLSNEKSSCTIKESDTPRTLKEFLEGCINLPKNSKSPVYGNWSYCLYDVVVQSDFLRHFQSEEAMMEQVIELNKSLFDTVVHGENYQIKDYITVHKPERFDTNTCKKFRDTYKHSRSNKVMCLHLIVNYGFMEIILDKTFNFPDLNYHQYLLLNRPLNFNNPPTNHEEEKCLDDFFGKITDGKTKLCPVCQVSVLKRDTDRASYHFGHIQAKTNGGSNLASNLIPVCPKCNLDCRSENMKDYCQRKFGRGFLH